MYYSRISEPNHLRVALLESTREIILFIGEQRKLQAMRERKKQLLYDLRRDMKDIQELSRKLDALMPNRELREEAMKLLVEMPLPRKIDVPQKKAMRALEPLPELPKVRSVPAKRMPSAPMKIPVRQQPAQSTNDIDRLAYTLSKIEQKLAELNK